MFTMNPERKITICIHEKNETEISLELKPKN